MSELTIVHYFYLALLLPAVVLVVACWFCSKGTKRTITAVAQLVVAIAVILGFSRLESRRATPLSEPGSLVKVADESASMRGAQPLADFETAGAVVFAAAANRVDDQSASTSGSELQSNIAAGVGVAAAQGASAIVLATDGVQSSGNLLAAAQALDQPLFVLRPPSNFDMRIVSAYAAPAQPHRTVVLEVVVESNVKAEAKLAATIPSRPPLSTAAQIEPGRQTLTMEFPAAAKRFETIDLELQCDVDGRLENNKYQTTWNAAPAARVALVHASAAAIEPIARRLTALGWDPQHLTPMQLNQQSLRASAAVILFGPATETQQSMLQAFVEGGGGLVVVGGEPVFGSSALADSNWQSWLPVNASPAKETSRPASFAMVLIIDKSESMQYENRLEMAKQAAKRTVQLLDPTDQVGVLAFGTKSDWVSEVAPCGDKKDLLARIDSLKVEGETNMYPAIERAQLALEQLDADHRHLILLTDGVSSPGDFDAAAGRLKQEGISVATVSVSSGAEQLMLKDIARIAGGSHYHCESAEELPNILVRATQQATQAIGPQEYSVFTMEGGVEGVDLSKAPRLTGVVGTAPKDDTVLAYLTDDGQPLFVWRDHGEGTVATLICDSKTLLGGDWKAWPQSPRFWESFVRKVEAESPPDLVRIDAALRDGRLTVDVDIRDDGQWVNNAQVRLRMADGGPTTAKPLALIAPGRYRGEWRPGGESSELRGEVDLVYATGRVESRPWSVRTNYAREFDSLSPDVSLLASAARLSGGGMIDSPNDIPAKTLAPTTTFARESNPLWYWCAAAAIVLLLAETLLRRWSLQFGVIDSG